MKIFGYTAGEMVGTSITRLFPANRFKEENQILEKIKRGESVEHFETQRQSKDGRLIDVSVTASPIKDAAGKVIGVSKVARDITGRKRAEAELSPPHLGTGRAQFVDPRRSVRRCLSKPWWLPRCGNC